jgi:alcohol dehydrogenase class IV
LNAPAVFQFTARACPERHLDAAKQLGADTRGAGLEDAGEVLSRRLIELMQATGMPNGLEAIGYTPGDLDALTSGSFPQQGLIRNAPLDTSREALRDLFANGMRYY